MADHRLAAEQLFRTKYGDVLAALLRLAGYQHFELAEEAVQIAFQRALEKWPAAEAPQNPAGWLYTVARNAYLEALRRLETEQRKLPQLPVVGSTSGEEVVPPDAFSESASALDDLATMILLCCNPELSPKAQICLTLKAACGFSVLEIARALGMQEEAAKKTITRAKAKVAADRAPFRAINAERITARFGLVLETLYVLFNEGYAASSGDTHLRRDIAAEAIRLADVLLHTAITPSERKGELHALLALMLLQFARFDARSTATGVPIRLQEQERSQWNRSMIGAGLVALEASQSSATVTAFHLEARIAAEHATSLSFEQTNWPVILLLYDQLLRYKDSPEVRLSRIVALRYAQGWQVAMAELDQLHADTVARSFLLHAIRADLLESAGRPAAAVQEWQRARSYAPTTADRAFIDQKLANLS